MPSRQHPDPEATPGWSLRVESAASAAVVRAFGEFDIAAVADVHRVISEVAAGLGRPARVVMDLAGVSFLDAAMLSTLVTERRALLSSGLDLRLQGVSSWSLRIIEICGLRETLGL